MPRILIIGYGNTLRGDDGFGFLSAERLKDLIHDPEVQILAVHQLTPELMDHIRSAGRVIFIDAAAVGEPGVIHRRELVPLAGDASLTHQATPSALLRGAQVLFGCSPRATLFSAPGESFELSEALTPRVGQALNSLVAEILAMCLAVESGRSPAARVNLPS